MRICLLAVGVGLLLVSCPTFGLAEKAPEDGNGAYATGKYRNLFAEDGHSKTGRSRPRSMRLTNQLFHGDPQTQAIAFAAGSNANGPLMYVTDWANHDVRTEGMSYGMMIAVQLDKKAEFDAIWNWAKTYMYVIGSEGAQLSVLCVVVQNRWDAQLRGCSAGWRSRTSPWRCCLRRTAGETAKGSTTIMLRRTNC